MKKHIVDELEVAVPADTLWAIYSTLQFPELIVNLLPNVFQNIEINGDGSLDTVFNVNFVQGTVPSSYKEKIVTINNEKRLKEVEHVEGGYLDMGCSFYMNSFEIVEKDPDSCIIKSMVTYEMQGIINADAIDGYHPIPNAAELALLSQLMSNDEGMVDNIVVLSIVAKAMSKYVLDKQSEAAAP